MVEFSAFGGMHTGKSVPAYILRKGRSVRVTAARIALLGYRTLLPELE